MMFKDSSFEKSQKTYDMHAFGSVLFDKIWLLFVQTVQLYGQLLQAQWVRVMRLTEISATE